MAAEPVRRPPDRASPLAALRSSLADLLDPRATLDASYHANQLVRAMDLISTR